MSSACCSAPSAPGPNCRDFAARTRRPADVYTTVLRGIPDLLVIYLFYFGGSQVLTSSAHALDQRGFCGLNGFMVGTLAVGIVSGAYQTEVLRGAYHAIPARRDRSGTRRRHVAAC